MSTITIGETLPPVECTAWCEDGSGHPDAWHPNDQYCLSESRRVTLSRYPYSAEAQSLASATT